MRRIIAQARKELTQVFRDRLTLALALLLPLVLLALLGKAISLSVTNIPVVVQDLDRTPSSRRYIETLQASLTFRVAPLPLSTQPPEALERNEAYVAIVIPPQFERSLQRDRETEVQWLVDATDANTANIMRATSVALTQDFLTRMNLMAGVQPAIRAEIRFWYNPGRESEKHIGTGAFAVMLALFPPLLAALATSREDEQKTILQVYVSSISAQEYLLGKALAFMCVAIAEWVLLLASAIPLFGLRFAGTPAPLFLSTMAYLFCSVSFGLLVGTLIRNQAAAIQATQTVAFLLSFLLSGFIFPIANIPTSVRWISHLVPARYYIEVTRDAFLRGGGWAAVWHVPVMLALLGSLFFLIAWLRMRRMQMDV
ncbi:ABC transporter permease [Pyrinomonas methylaliphatogenes]|uniref:ABC-type multidrug transport system, permease component n=1 Tax=Pyrinomonas methylaliphatogenes TaxID=454194 RepID=A0A0B6WWR3_9BACT|nr:ABC transporter permease [Pyrinomonas methylaliphatogenes]CDM64575.1 ABC-type multidrug transport system, permease component [Pyrinomonas methylaliphatogenes]